jgi:two-component system, OmpR family, response regulator
VISYSAIVNPSSTLMRDEVKKKPPVLIIDDEVDICYLLKGIMRLRNIEANYATSLAEAQIQLQKTNPSVIFLDNHLSDGMGMDYISLFKKEHPSASIVMITAHDTPVDREKAYKEGVDFFIGKPFNREVILKTLEKIDFS